MPKIKWIGLIEQNKIKDYQKGDLAKNAIVFIDEFDSTKDRILDHLIEVSLKNQIDYLEAYKQIYHNLKQADLPSDMTIASEAQKKTPYKAKGLKDRLTK